MIKKRYSRESIPGMFTSQGANEQTDHKAKEEENKSQKQAGTTKSWELR